MIPHILMDGGGTLPDTPDPSGSGDVQSSAPRERTTDCAFRVELPESPSAVMTLKTSPRGEKWRHQTYAVQKTVVEKILQDLDVQSTVGAFSVEGTARISRWWGPGSPEAEDAFSQGWGG